jgi:fatty acid desaturase
MGAGEATSDSDVHFAREANLPAHFRTASNAYGALALVVNFGPLLALLAAAPLVWRNLGPLWVIALIPFTGLFAYRLTLIMHDCAHRTLFSRQSINKTVGTVTGYLLASDFETFTANHFAHHRSYGAPGDPQGNDYLHLQGSSRSAILWHLLRPLVCYNLFKLGQFAPQAPDGDAPPNVSKIAPPRRASRPRFIAGVLAAQLVIAAIATGFGKYPILIVLYPLSAATFGLFFSQIRGFAEHIADEGTDENGAVRTHLPNRFDRLFFYALNFNYHVEHHLYPYVPSWQLPEVHPLIADECHSPATLSTSIVGTIRRRLRMCPR